MSADTSVKYFHSAMAGAPSLSTTAGTLIALLDACLVNGFGLKSVDSLVVSGGVATLTISTGHSFEPNVVALVAGATPSALNGEKRVLSTTTTTVTFDATGVSDQTATGTITAKLAPLGWAKPFTGTNLAAYKASDVTALGMYLRVDDTAAISARVVGYESMTDVNTGTGPFPSSSQVSGGAYWHRCGSGVSTARPWVFIGDGRAFYLAVQGNSTGYMTYSFGDITAYKSGDAFACQLSANFSDQSNQAASVTGDVGWSSAIAATNAAWFPRAYHGLGGSLGVARLNLAGASQVAGSSTNYGTYPNASDNSLLVLPVVMYASVGAIRGELPGLLHPIQVTTGLFNARDVVQGTGAYAGKKLMAIPGGGPLASNSVGNIFIDITGPWR